jgi:hypothetical protein
VARATGLRLMPHCSIAAVTRFRGRDGLGREGKRVDMVDRDGNADADVSHIKPHVRHSDRGTGVRKEGEVVCKRATAESFIISLSYPFLWFFFGDRKYRVLVLLLVLVLVLLLLLSHHITSRSLYSVYDIRYLNVSDFRNPLLSLLRIESSSAKWDMTWFTNLRGRMSSSSAEKRRIGGQQHGENQNGNEDVSGMYIVCILIPVCFFGGFW